MLDRARHQRQNVVSTSAGLKSKKTWIAFASLLGIGVYLIARFLFRVPERYSEWALIAVLVAGAPLLFDLLKKHGSYRSRPALAKMTRHVQESACRFFMSRS